MLNDRIRPVVAIAASMDEYHQRVLGAAQRVLAGRGIPLISHMDGPYSHGAGSPLLVAVLTRSSPCGVIALNQIDEGDQLGMRRLLSGLDLPLVHVGVSPPGASAVHGDNQTGMRQLLTHLLDERGARTLALVRGSMHQPDSIERERIVRDELRMRGLELDEELIVTGQFTPEIAYRELRRLLGSRRDMDAVVALNDRMAVAALAALTDAGLRVPQDVALTGFDDHPSASQWPGLTTVDQHLERQGELAAQLLLERIDGAAPRTVALASRLVVRGSTAGRGEPAVTETATAARMAELSQRQLAAQDGILAMSHALDYCWTVGQTVNVLGEHLARLGVHRCFLALYVRSQEPSTGAAESLAFQVSTDRAQLVLDYREGELHYPAPEPFDVPRLLPDTLERELRDGLLFLQPLSVLDRPIGYVLFEQRGGSVRLAELLRIDLGRAIDGVLTTEETHSRAAMLERAVARRTEELRVEVLTRRRAERELQEANVVLHRSSMLDGLTQIANRSAFELFLREHWDRGAVAGHVLTMLMIDVDAFKAYNDHYGHVAGDEALRVVAGCVAGAVRDAQDLACRYGGEEFAVLLPRSDLAVALAVAGRFRELLADAGVEHAASPVGPSLTASVGIATATPTPDGDPGRVVEAADRALYRAKALGRDRVVVDERVPEGAGAAGPRPSTTAP